MSTWSQPGASGGPCGGLEEKRTKQPRQSGRAGLTQANRPPRKPVWFTQRNGGTLVRTAGRARGELDLLLGVARHLLSGRCGWTPRFVRG